MIVYLNNQFVDAKDAVIPITDRGILLGDGVFETLRVDEGFIEGFRFHYRRFEASALIMGIPMPQTRSAIGKIVLQLLEKNNLFDKQAVVRMTLTRGSGPRGLAIPEQVEPTLFIQVFPFHQEVCTHFSMMISGYRYNPSAPLCYIKHLGYQLAILARQEAQLYGFNEAALLNDKGDVISATAGNIFVIKNDRILAPSLTTGCLPGVTRGLLIRLAKRHKMPIDVVTFSCEDMLSAQSVFVTNSLMGIRPVTCLQAQALNTQHPLLEELMGIYYTFQAQEKAGEIVIKDTD